MPGPTPFADLNDVLAQFTRGVQEALGENFCGSYLQGSFAVGDADMHSDVDFIVATHEQVTKEQQSELQALHERLFALDIPWAQHLEGSYVSKERLRRVDPSRAPFFYFDNGATRPAWDNHCNTAVVRWSLREHGVVLAGPPPIELVDPVSPDDLRAEVRSAMDEWASWGRASQARFEAYGRPGMSRWKQALLVLSFCRILHTVERGTVTSKRAAGEWALVALDASWGDLIQRALDDRPDPWTRVHQPADAAMIERTLAFIDYALDLAGRA